MVGQVALPPGAVPGAGPRRAGQAHGGDPAGGAAWEDGKLGMGHIGRWERITVVAREAWMRHAVTVFGYLIPGEVEAYDLADEADASAWITS